MATALALENRKLRRRLQEVEEEVSFLRDQNYNIQRVNDTYREKLLQHIEAVRFKACGESSPAFATADDLKGLVHRLRAHDVTHSPPRPRVTAAAAAAAAADAPPKGSLPREGDDGLMRSTSSLSRATQEGEGNGRGPRRKAVSSSMGEKSHAKQSATVQSAQRATIAKLRAENKKLASLVDTLRLRVAAAGRLNASLEKKCRGLSSAVGRAQTSGLKYQQDGTGKKPLPSPQLRKRSEELREENEKLRADQERNRYLAQEVSHYRTLLEQRGKEVEILRQRESLRLEEMNGVKGKLVKAAERLQTMGTALRLSKVREKRATSATESLRKKYEEQKEQCVAGPEIRPNSFFSTVIEQVSKVMGQHHSLLSKCLLVHHALHVLFYRGFADQEAEEAAHASDEEWKGIGTESLLEAVTRLTHLLNLVERKAMVPIAPATPDPLTLGSINLAVPKQTGGVGGCRRLGGPADTRLRTSLQLVAGGSDDSEDAGVEGGGEESSLSGNSMREARLLPRGDERGHLQMRDAATMTVSPVQISLALGRSLPVSPLQSNRATETISPPLISVAVGPGSDAEESVLILPAAYSVAGPAAVGCPLE
ncbi:uncharacterized protein Tco025E_00948 [Trypanosoma conorhini]|uniref:Uncharacterized protein n=1 Tax=Trypanosoma conorhini TaxID=83891 RepID=A0A3R7PXS9_9TRYP|nr:uncharacterized protein Tco025E_00948 [Trypanosoma conorhini]RNF26866.1 hypothetical protein Tco025E_00948 [Trypanosoma conorhini]